MHNNFSINQYQNVSFRAKPIPKDVIDESSNSLLDKNVKTVNIYCHSSADEDTYNSAKVYANWLIRHGKQVKLCIEETESKDLYKSKCEATINNEHQKADKVVLIDFNAHERIPSSYISDLYQNSPKNILGFDHHIPSESTLEGNIYIDTTAKSCSGVITRFMEGINEKISHNDAKSLYCGMVSDYKKSGLVKLNRNGNKYELTKTEKLYDDKNSTELINKLERQLSQRDKQEIYKHLDPLSRLSSDEKDFRKHTFKNIQVSPNGKLAYVIIEPDDKLWAKVGMDNQKTSAILKDLRYRISTDNQNMDEYSNTQKEKLKDVKTVIAFYRKNNTPDSEYRMSIHSRDNKALDIIDYVKNINPKFDGGGHEDRAGGRLLSIDKNDTHQLVNDFITASEIL